MDEIDPDFLWKDYTYFSGQTDKIVEHFEEFSTDLIMKYFPTDCMPYVLDIGSNDGSLLLEFKKLGCKIQGIDPAQTVVSAALQKGVETCLGLFNLESSERFFGDRKFDLITAFNVFAHSADMISMGAAVAKCLSKNGLFCFEVQYLTDIIDKKILGTFFHEHMIHYSYYSAQNFLSQFGLGIIDYERNNIQNGSIIFHVAHKNSDMASRHTNHEKLGKLALEETNFFDDQRLWIDTFNTSLVETKASFRNFLAVNNIETLPAYGAARSGPTLAIQFGFENYLSSFFDDHLSKVNKFSPLKGLPVFPTSQLDANLHPFVVITAYIHYKNIIRKHHDFLVSGGIFLLVWPNFEIITIDNYSDFLA
ncbi:hypothetical protein KR100_01430 [Synechococcus sp. KORDI-100]|nr:hypothetical protein KR100_01430 [Synechococcus sp. KORDI-100]